MAHPSFLLGASPAAYCRGALPPIKAGEKRAPRARTHSDPRPFLFPGRSLCRTILTSNYDCCPNVRALKVQCIPSRKRPPMPEIVQLFPAKPDSPPAEKDAQDESVVRRLTAEVIDLEHQLLELQLVICSQAVSLKDVASNSRRVNQLCFAAVLAGFLFGWQLDPPGPAHATVQTLAAPAAYAVMVP